MKLVALSLALVTGCAATASAVGSLIKPKPPEVTVVTNVSVPAPAPAARHDGPGKAIAAGALAGGVAAVIVRTTPTAIASGVLIGAGVGYVVHAMTD